MTRITILVPTYNAASTISETLNSVQNNLDNACYIDHIYIADDSSTDNTIDLCKEVWKRSNVKMTIIEAKSNVGERANINRAVLALDNKYDWLLLIHADDLAKNNWLEEMCGAIMNSSDEVASISSSYDVLKENGSIEVGEDRNELSKITGDRSSIKETLLNGTWWHISGCAIKISVLKNSGGFNKNLPQYGDMEWLLRIMSTGYSIIYLPKSLTTYRQLETSISSISFKIHRDLFELANLVIAYKSLFTFIEMFKFYCSMIYSLFRRIVKSILSLNFLRLKNAIILLLRLTNLYFIKRKPAIHIEVLRLRK